MKEPVAEGDDVVSVSVSESEKVKAGDKSGTRTFGGTGGLLGVPMSVFHLGLDFQSSSVVMTGPNSGIAVRDDVSGGPIGIGLLPDVLKTSSENGISVLPDGDLDLGFDLIGMTAASSI